MSHIQIFTGEKIIRKVIDNQLNFKSHLKDIFRKTNQKLSAHSRKWKISTFNQQKKTVNFFFNPQFSYCL